MVYTAFFIHMFFTGIPQGWGAAWNKLCGNSVVMVTDLACAH